MYREKKWRSIVKTWSWTIIGTLTTFILVLLFGLKLKAATAMATIELILRWILYYFHERIYNTLKFGREEISPFVVWFTGLPESGKTILANSLYNEILSLNRKAEWFDGGNVREIFPSLGYSKDDRNTHVERIGYMSSILVKNNIAVIASFISPYKESRNFIRKLTKNFIEVYVNTPLEICEQRDSKGFYKKARSGEIKNFTGISDPYEIPEKPEIVLSTTESTLNENLSIILAYLKNKKLI